MIWMNQDTLIVIVSGLWTPWNIVSSELEDGGEQASLSGH